MPDNTDANVATADVLTLLLYNQHALAAAIEEVALWAKAKPMRAPSLHWKLSIRTRPPSPLEFSSSGSNRYQRSRPIR
jgi:hypothetical protein